MSSECAGCYFQETLNPTPAAAIPQVLELSVSDHMGAVEAFTEQIEVRRRSCHSHELLKCVFFITVCFKTCVAAALRMQVHLKCKSQLMRLAAERDDEFLTSLSQAVASAKAAKAQDNDAAPENSSQGSDASKDETALDTAEITRVQLPLHSSSRDGDNKAVEKKSGPRRSKRQPRPKRKLETSQTVSVSRATGTGTGASTRRTRQQGEASPNVDSWSEPTKKRATRARRMPTRRSQREQAAD